MAASRRARASDVGADPCGGVVPGDDRAVEGHRIGEGGSLPGLRGCPEERVQLAHPVDHDKAGGHLRAGRANIMATSAP